jgi:hypothetical protein
LIQASMTSALIAAKGMFRRLDEGVSRSWIRPEEALWARWIWLRALGLIFLSAFYSLAFQIIGLLGPRGILGAEGERSGRQDTEPGEARGPRRR